MKTMELWNNVPGMCEETPVLEYYPAENRKTDATVVILPGGGYSTRAQHEGKGYAEFLNSLGMDAFVCQYRVAPHRHPLPLLDARRAVQMVRHLSKELGLAADKVGIMGSSAGGHLAALTCTCQETYPDVLQKTDDIDKIDALPNFQILCYPVIALNDFGHIGSGDMLLGNKDVYSPARYALSAHNIVHDKTPKAFIWHTIEDQTVPVQNSLSYVSALHAKNIEAELHIFPKGAHGAGLAAHIPHTGQWSKLLENWFRFYGLL